MGWFSKKKDEEPNDLDLEEFDEEQEVEKSERQEIEQHVEFERFEVRHYPSIRYDSIILPDEPCPTQFVAIDFETATTSGFACQLGIVEVDNGTIVAEKEYLFQPPENKYDWACTFVHHLSAASTADAKTFADYWPEIKAALDGKTIVAHNASFDIRVLNYNIDYYGLGSLKVGDVICTFHELRNTDLYSACAFFGIEIQQHHDALSDARACAQLLMAYSKRPGGIINIPKLKEKKGNTKVAKEHRKPSEDADPNSPAYGKRFVLTGCFERWPDRDELAAIITNMGGFVSSSVSGKTDYLVLGEAPGDSKIAKAEELQRGGGKISIIFEKDLIELLHL